MNGEGAAQQTELSAVGFGIFGKSHVPIPLAGLR